MTHHREKRKQLREAAHEARAQRVYSLAPGDYAKIYKFQGGRCALCQRGKGISRRLAVDHNHKCCDGPVSCGKCVRGLVCGRCNSMLAHARDDLAYFERAISYLISPPVQRLRKGPP